MGGSLGGGQAAAGDDFRVDNEVFVEGRKKPESRSTTIFCEGSVYDYLGEPAEVIVFDRAGGRFIMLDTARRVRAELSTEEVLAFTQRLQERARAQSDPFIKFLAVPRFEKEYDEASGELTLSSPWMVYRLVLAGTESRAIARQYREFSDWYARLNTLLSPGSRPPFARLAVNAELAQHEATAREVYLTLRPKESSLQGATIRSRHRLVGRLGEADLDRVAQTRQFMEIFERVNFQQYRRVGRP